MIKDTCFTPFSLSSFSFWHEKMDIDTFFAYSDTKAASAPRLFPAQILDIHVTMLFFFSR
jgi:hypothetical protein